MRWIKHLFVLYIIVISSNQLYSQSYYHFPDSDAIWRQYSFWFDGTNGICRDYQLYIQNDTSINSITYKNLYWSGTYGLYPNCNFAVFSHGEPYIAYREDTISRKVFVFDYVNSQEYLLYDFNLSLGDTLLTEYPLAYHQGGYFIYVSEIDTIIVGNQYRKRFKLSLDNWFAGPQINYVSLIEGVGSDYGFTGNLLPNWQEKIDLLICHKLDSQDVYPSGQVCNLVNVGIIESKKENMISIYPNPTYRSFILSTLQEIGEVNVIIEIYNSVGAKVDYDRHDSKITLTNPIRGIYFVSIKIHEKYYHSKVLIH